MSTSLETLHASTVLFLENLHQRLPMIDTAWFKFIAGIIVLLNPVAMLPQLVRAFTAPPQELLGVSVSMFCIFAAIQTAVVASAIRAREPVLYSFHGGQCRRDDDDHRCAAHPRSVELEATCSHTVCRSRFCGA